MSKALRNYGMTRNDVHNPLSHQVQNNAGGFVYEISDKSRLERFLILGVDGGTYYVSEEDLTKQNVDWLIELIKTDPDLVLNTIHDVSVSGRAYRNSAAIFTLALVLNHGSSSDKTIAAAIAPEIARTATMVFELAQYLENLGGWGRAKRRAIANWFTEKSPDALAYQAVKYRQRNGWTLRDLMRLSHPVGVDQNVGNFILGHSPRMVGNVPNVIDGFISMQDAQSLAHVIQTLDLYPNLSWETIPTQFLKSPEVWEKLFYNNQLRGVALVRNVTRMAKIGAFDDTNFRNGYAAALEEDALNSKLRLHPIQFLNASIVYEEGSIDRKNTYGWSISRNKNWNTDPTISQALQNGFYNSFKNIVPTGRSFLIGVDVSSSMASNAAAGADMTSAQAAAAMSLIFAKAENDVHIHGFADTFRDLNITPNMSFREVLDKVSRQNFGATDMSLPMQFAARNHMKVDGFVIITDNEVNHGRHAAAELSRYRNGFNPEAKLAVMATTATNFSIADPNDAGMLDVVGFDSNAPKLITDFVRGF